MGKRLDSPFSKEDVQMFNKHMNKCSTWLITGEKQMRTTWDTPSHQPHNQGLNLGPCFSSLTGWLLTTQQQNRKQQVLVRMCGNWDPPTLVVGMKNGAAMIENTMEDPQKVKNRTAMRTRKKKKNRTATWSRNPTCVRTQMNWKQGLKDIFAHPCPVQHYSQ